MRQFPLWGHLLFVAALFALCIFYCHDLTVPVVLLSCWLSSGIYRILVKNNQIKWLLPSGLVLALFLGCLYYIADFIIFPHSLGGAHRLRNACFMGPLLAWAGLFAETYSPAGKRVAKDHVLKDTAIERRR